MRIGIYDPYLDDLGGGEKYMMTIASCLSKNNQVSVFWDKKSDLDDLISRFSLNLSDVVLRPNIFSSNISFTKRLLESRKYDVIIVLSDGSIPLVLSKKLFIHVQQPLEQFQNSSFKDRLKLMRVSQFFCNSNYTKTFISKKFELKTSVIYPPVKLFPKKIKKENIILNVGRFRVRDIRTIRDGKNVAVGDYKKQAVMISAFKNMVDDGLKNWKFVIATSVKKEDVEVFEKTKKEALGYPIEFLVNKKNDDLWDIYSKSKIYWHASGFGEDLVSHPEFAEHFGISTVEAMGAGNVPVVINAGGQKEIVQDSENGYLWDSLKELQEKTLMLTKNEKLLSQISEKARVQMKNFLKEFTN